MALLSINTYRVLDGVAPLSLDLGSADGPAPASLRLGTLSSCWLVAAFRAWEHSDSEQVRRLELVLDLELGLLGVARLGSRGIGGCVVVGMAGLAWLVAGKFGS